MPDEIERWRIYKRRATGVMASVLNKRPKGVIELTYADVIHGPDTSRQYVEVVRAEDYEAVKTEREKLREEQRSEVAHWFAQKEIPDGMGE